MWYSKVMVIIMLIKKNEKFGIGCFDCSNDDVRGEIISF